MVTIPVIGVAIGDIIMDGMILGMVMDIGDVLLIMTIVLLIMEVWEVPDREELYQAVRECLVHVLVAVSPEQGHRMEE